MSKHLVDLLLAGIIIDNGTVQTYTCAKTETFMS